MEQIKYQGYARERGFNPIQMSTASVDAIGQQGNNLLRQMKDNSDIERRNRDAYQSQVERNQGIEEQNRRENRQFERASDRAVFEGRANNLRTQANNYLIRSQQDEKTFAALAAFSGTISKVVLDQKKKRDELAELEGANIAFESGITFEEYQSLKTGEARIEAADTQVNSIANKLKAAGYSEEYIAKIRNLSGRQLYGASKQWAVQGGENYGAFRAEMADRPFEINGQQITLAQAADGSPETFQAVNTLVRAEYLKRFRGLNQAFANEYLYEGMRKQESKERLLYAEKRSKELELDRTQKETNDLLTEWQAGRGEGVLNWIQRMSGGDPKELGEKRRSALGYLVSAAKAGKFTSDDLMELESTQFIPNGESKAVAFGDRFGMDMPQLRAAVREYNNQVRADREQATDDAKSEFEQRLNQFASDRPLSKDEVREAISEWQSRGYGSPPAWLKSMETAEELADETGDAILLQKKVDGMLTMRELNSGRYSAKLRDKYDDAAKKQELVPADVKTNIFNAVDAELKESIGRVDKGYNQNGDFFIAQGVARRMVSERASALIGQGVVPQAAWDQARDDVIKQIESGRQGKGMFSIRMQQDGKSPDLKNPGFQLAGNGTGAEAQRQRARQLQAKLTTNPKALFTEKILTEEEILQLEGFRQGGGSIPPIIWALTSRIKNASPFDIADAQMKAYGRPALQRPPSAQLYEGVRPEFRQLLTWRPSIDRTLRAVEGGTGGANMNPYQPVLDLIASKESLSTDPKLNGYDAMNKGGRDGGHTAIGSGTGTATFGRPLTQMSVSEVLSLGRQGRIHAAGRYQFIHSTLQGLVDRGVARPGEMFNEQVQDKIAISYLRERTGKFWAGQASAQSYVPGLGNAWIGLQKLKTGQLAAAMEQAKANLSSSNIDATRLRPQVAYRVGNIGPTSTGAHLDVKDVTGAFFRRDSLDKYISFKMDGGLAPLSKGVTVPGGEFGAGRSYGRHLGWDYAVPAGTPVVLKNGARVISKKPSEHGDVLTIATPDGRRFTFLHGKAS